MPSIASLIKVGGHANAVALGAAGGPPGILISLAASIGIQIIGNLLKPRKKTPPQEILPLEEITAEIGTTVPVVLGTAFIEQTMVIGVYQSHIITVPAPENSKTK